MVVSVRSGASTHGHARGPGPQRLGYLPGLDGLRALAVTGVLLFHSGVGWAGGGFLGVDAFFVLSGFLITSLLLAEHRGTGHLSLRAFWARRARRLLPALFLVLLAVSAYAAVVLTGPDRARIRGDAIAALAYFANWHFAAAPTGYFDQAALPSPLQHTWSLSIEEQFYLVWPLLVAGCLAVPRWFGRRTIATFAIAGAAASAFAMWWLTVPGADPSRAYYGTDTRAQSLLVGALLALALEARGGRRLPAWSRTWLLTLGPLAAVALGAMWYVARGDSRWLYHGGFALHASLVAALIASVVTVPSGPAGRVLALLPLRFLGRISYGVYLWHWPLFLVLDGSRTGLRGPALLGVRLAATLVVSVASYYLVESPVRHGLLRAWRAPAALAGTVAAVVIAIVLSTTPPSAPTTASLLAGSSAATGARPSPMLSAEPQPSIDPTRPARSVMVFGDSVAASLGYGLSHIKGGVGTKVINWGTLGCGIAEGSPYMYFGQETPELPQCHHWQDKWRAALATVHPDTAVLLAGRWEVMDRTRDGHYQHIGEPAYDNYLKGQLRQAISALQSTGARVVVLTAPYYLRGERPDGGLWPEDETWRVDRWNTLVREVVAEQGGRVRLVDLGRHINPDGHYSNTMNGLYVREDGVHFTQDFVTSLAPWLVPQLVAPLGGVSASTDAPPPTPSPSETANP